MGDVIPPRGGHFEHKSAAEAWAAAGWGGKKALEEYEMQRDRLLDSGLNLGTILLVPPHCNRVFVGANLLPFLAIFGDDYDESDMWK